MLADAMRCLMLRMVIAGENFPDSVFIFVPQVFRHLSVFHSLTHSRAMLRPMMMMMLLTCGLSCRMIMVLSGGANYNICAGRFFADFTFSRFFVSIFVFQLVKC